jgi:Rne/Rng family ribonuclease
MSKELFVSSTPHETKVAIVEDDQLSEIYYERENEYTLAGSIYKGRVTRVLPGMQSAFVNIGLERDAFLYVSDFLLEEDEDAEGLDQVVARPHIIASPAQGQDEPEQGEDRGASTSGRAKATQTGPAEVLGEGLEVPLEATDMMAPAEADSAEEESAGGPGASSGPREDGSEQEREGARRWRGRRRRRGGRGRFQDREEREDRATHRQQPEERPQAEEPAASQEPRQERPTGGHAPNVLPGESISKYQPRSSAPAPQAETKPPRTSPKPSTEYTIQPSQFSPGAMVLPGESISKYRGQKNQPRPAAPEPEPADVRPLPEEHGFLQDVESAGPVPHVAEQTGAEHQMEPLRPPVEVVATEVEAITPPPPPVEEKVERKRHAETEEARLEHMNLAATFGGDAAESGEEAAAHDVEESAGEAGRAERIAAASAETGAVPGVVEEEEIEEDESDLPGFEEDADLTDYEEMEEEVLGSGNDQMVAAGRELTEAVRDAHINERATGQYEAEGLDPEELEEVAEVLGLGEEDENGHEELEPAEGEGEDLEGARAEHRAAAGTAAYQQTQRTDRRGVDRRTRRGARRPMRGRRHQAPRHLPAISDLLKEGQEILVQIAKEPIAKKGARITSHIALPGRFLVYMPTVHHTGVSRKIASEEERHRLKRIALSERGEAQGGFIVRTAASGASEEDLRADIRFLINLWTEIRGRAESSKAPALIYHDLNLVERILRDQVTTSFSQIWADTEAEYERVLRFVSRFQPSLVKRVKLYSKETPLFEQFSITDEINKALKSKVWLKSGGYIVINQTEALVAIDVNTGKYVGKTARLEDTIVKTNIDAIREIVRQIRLRDLGGIIVIDFIDMDERKNRHKVMQALEDALKADRAPSKVLQFNDFGLVAITRKRVKQSLERTLGQPCPTCQATGMIKSVTTVCNEIYVEMRKMSRHFERDIMLRVNPEVAKALKTNSGKWLQEMEELTGRTVLVKSDPLLHPEHFDIQ